VKVSIDRTELVELARRSDAPERVVERFEAAVATLAEDEIQIGWTDPGQLTEIYHARYDNLREQGLQVTGLADAVELFATTDYMEQIGVVPVLGSRFNYTAFVAHPGNALLALIEVPASLSAPTPPPGAPAR
jgi:hypothetical protein